MDIHLIIIISFFIFILSFILWVYKKQNKFNECYLKNELYFQNLTHEVKNINEYFDKSFRHCVELFTQQKQEAHHQFAKLSENFHLLHAQQNQQFLNELNNSKLQQEKAFAHLHEKIAREQSLFRNQIDQHQINSLKSLQESLQGTSKYMSERVIETLTHNAKLIDNRLEKLTNEIQLRLHQISTQVENRLTEGFDKTTATFTDIVKRLALIDAAQKKITELSTNVVSLQEILADKRSRGAFGEIQLNALIQNMMPSGSYQFQVTLSNSKRADCILYLPQPTGHVVIDAKFPLENFRHMTNLSHSEETRKNFEQQFRIDIRKHIQDIAEKYIIPDETSEGAMMFIPAEAVFAEIHSHYPELIEFAHRVRVWLVSPTTMMAVLTTARAVLKDAATQKQVHIIQEHLRSLAKDFDRFQKRMDSLAKHIDQAQCDVKEVNMSAKKITSRFDKIEKVELPQEEQLELQ